MAKLLLLAILAIYLQLQGTHGHGRLMEPVNRSSAWRKGFETPVNYDDDGNYCGGLSVHIRNGGKCGLCGDNFVMKQPRSNENTGTYGTGTIVATYKRGQKIKLQPELTANHRGFFRFAICPLNHSKELETEECFAKYPLKLEDGSDKFKLKTGRRGLYDITGVLPADLTCEHCVLRWEYVAGNNWGKCTDGSHQQGCGPQETFRTCSDIRIVAN